MSFMLLAGSVAAVLVLAGLAHLLKLGGDPLDEPGARDCATAALPDFEAVAALVGMDGAAALVRSADGRVALVKRHGARAAARLLEQPLHVTKAEGGGIVWPQDRGFGPQQIAGYQVDDLRRFAAPDGDGSRT